MQLIRNLIDKVRQVQPRVSQLFADNLKNDEHNFLEQVKWEQLWHGLAADGQPLTPSYLNDPWFKSKQKASNYMEWKQSITPNPKRKPENPNLFINGKFYGTLEIFFRPDEFEIDSADPTGADIIRKYGKAAFGLNSNYLNEYVKSRYYNKVLKVVKSVILGS